MTSAIPGISGGVATATATSSVDRGDQFDSQTFLKLLVAEMQYQDPSNPMSSSDMMSQEATLTQTQALQQLVQQNTTLLASQQAMAAGALVGRAVSYTDTAGATQTGTITSVSLGGSDMLATIGGQQIPLGRITQVSQSSAPTA